VKIEAGIGQETGVAFFNTFQAMGGPGTMGRWYASEPRLVGADFIHPMPAGAKIVGELLYSALRDGYNDYKLRQLNKAVVQTASKE
jgi:lysophospholipase L1-like esterase